MSERESSGLPPDVYAGSGGARSKTGLRSYFRQLRAELDDYTGRSERLWAQLWAHFDSTFDALTCVMLYESLVGEPDTADVIAALQQRGVTVVVPGSSPDAVRPNMDGVQVVVVPGLTFTPGGARLGQGGGWYDRLLSAVGDDVLRVGVCFHEQLVDSLPTEPHDIPMHLIATDTSLHWVN